MEERQKGRTAERYSVFITLHKVEHLSFRVVYTVFYAIPVTDDTAATL